MSRDFSRIPLEKLVSWILEEERQDSIFGIHKSLFFTPSSGDPFSLTRYGQFLETPIGVAAGPHTQMAQNIVSAWLCGARYIELKTVQTLDRLNVSKPCIDMEDEGYNCEWSQELRLEDSFDEYLNAWIIIHLLKHKFGWGKKTSLGCIFNMSVGYNLEGILKENVQNFLKKMENCKDQLEAKKSEIRHLYPQIDNIEIPERISNNITLSTMHGCPPDEIEKIGWYLIKEKGYHTTIKLNPTLIGPSELRHILNERLGFPTQVPDEAFEHDLKYPDAIKIIKNLSEASREKNLHFSLKLTNTLESINIRGVFPENEKMNYMSGRALHPISINLAAKLQNEFDGKLDLTFSAGIDCFNISRVIACGIRPLTVCSDILKPGGYARLGQYLCELAEAFKREKASSIEKFILNWAKVDHYDVSRAALINLRRYAGNVAGIIDYQKKGKFGESVKTSRKLTPFDCVRAPCITTCPANQDIPSYMYYTSKGEYEKAYDIILRANPLPNITGMACDHRCQHRCTRTNYDHPLLIREIKRFIAEKNNFRPQLKPKSPVGKKVAIIGGGPSGLACAYFLALEGFSATVFETKAFPGGMVSDAIPAFRLTAEAIEKDISFLRNLGIEFKFDCKIDAKRFAELRKEFEFVYVAVGAQKSKKMDIPGEGTAGVIDFLTFLSNVRRGKKMDLGKRVAVIGGGNSAMDAARTAHRLLGPDGKVILLYRRTRAEMPADREEIEGLLSEHIEIRELVAPLEVVEKDGKVAGLKCQRMRLGEKGKDGRPKPEKIPGSEEVIPLDTIVPAIGQEVALEFIDPADFVVDPATGMTKLENVFAGGDAVRGGVSIIRAMADGRTAAENIMRKAGIERTIPAGKPDKGLSFPEFQKKSATRVKGVVLPEIESDFRWSFEPVIRVLSEEEAKKEAERCLYCDYVCNVCVTVCPNRANRTYYVVPKEYSLQKAVLQNDGYRIENV